jgi:hypothetical protein
MPRVKFLLTVAAYPLPSRSYDELVCTAGITEDGKWIRLYPVPLSFLTDLKGSGQINRIKYNWLELDLLKRTDDFRLESYSPVDYKFSDLKILGDIDTKANWYERKQYCLKNVYTNLEQLLKDSREPQNISLATFKPTEIVSFETEPDDRDWKPVWIEIRRQIDMFSKTESKEAEEIIPKVPYKFYYVFTDDTGQRSRLMIEDWEIGALYWNCLKNAKGDENVAVKKVKEKYFDDFVRTKDLYLFLGTTMQWHRRRAMNPFVIVGVFYPKKEQQIGMFLL